MNTKKLDKSDMLWKSTYEIIVEIQEENKTLKDNVEFLHSCLDDRDKSIAIMQEENKKLKSDLGNIQCEFWFECDECEFWKREIKKHKPCLIKEEYVFNLCDYDYQILTSTTPQLKIIKKNNKWSSTITIDWFTAIWKTFSSLADEEDLYEDTK